MELQSETSPIRFGSKATCWSETGGRLELALPVLGGDPESPLPLDLGHPVRRGHWSVWDSGSILFALGVLPVDGALSGTSGQLYDDAFGIAAERPLYRFWNFIPGINQETNGLENYRSFVLGRHDAFIRRYGQESASAQMPAATAVGVDDRFLVVAFLTGNTRPQHFENPNQLPAYAYPGQYGPKPPSFARATRVEIDGAPVFFLAGTSAVLGHASTGVGDLRRQTDITLTNLETMGERMGLSETLGRGAGLRRMFRVYLRRANDLDSIRPLVEDRLLEPRDQIVWLKTGICRADLDVEIEATLVG